MELFQSSLSNIDSIINKSQSKYSLYESISGVQNLEKSVSSKGDHGIVHVEESKVLAKADYSELQKLFGIHKFSFAEHFIGPHPDFSHLQHNQYLNHYAVSMFLDIKGSTLLSKKYDLLQIRQIKDTILTLSIQVCSFFGGHIQRLQGDGIFVYFVRNELHQNDAMINALNAASLLSFFMKYQLPKHFKDEDIAPPKIRVGIDYGDATKTIWSYYGLTGCRELTTTGLHTDLAAKLQARAGANGIRIGHNVVNELDLQDYLIKKVAEEEFIFDNSYRQWDFDWEAYLLTFDFIKRDSDRGLIFSPPAIRLKCQIAKNESDSFVDYPQNLFGIPKGYKIKFLLQQNGLPYAKKTEKEKIIWSVKNTGREARKEKAESPDVSKHNNTNTCLVDASYLGHHDMQCKIVKEYSDNINVRFPVFVR